MSLPKPFATAMPPVAAVAATAVKPKLFEYATILLTPEKPEPEINTKDAIRIHILHVISASLTEY